MYNALQAAASDTDVCLDVCYSCILWCDRALHLEPCLEHQISAKRSILSRLRAGYPRQDTKSPK